MSREGMVSLNQIQKPVEEQISVRGRMILRTKDILGLHSHDPPPLQRGFKHRIYNEVNLILKPLRSGPRETTAEIRNRDNT
jgi:hypothetical protein